MASNRVRFFFDGDSKGVDKAAASAEKSLHRMSTSGGKSLDGLKSRASGLTDALGIGLAGGFAAASVKAISLASDAAEVDSKLQVVFGKTLPIVSKELQSFADKTSASNTELRTYAADMGALLKPMGLGADATAKMSVQVAELAVDLGSFNNVPTADALESIRAGLVGEAEPMRKFGVLMNEAAVKAEAMQLGLGAVGRELSEQEKVQARYSLILKQTSQAQGDAERTAGSAANQFKELKSTFVDMAVEAGSAALPAVTSLTSGLTGLIGALGGVGPLLGTAGVFAGVKTLGPGIQSMGKGFAGIKASSTGLGGLVKGVGTSVMGTVGPFNLAGLAAAGLVGGFLAATAAATNMEKEATDVAIALQAIEDVGAAITTNNLQQRQSEMDLGAARKQHRKDIADLNVATKQALHVGAQQVIADTQEAASKQRVKQATSDLREARARATAAGVDEVAKDAGVIDSTKRLSDAKDAAAKVAVRSSTADAASTAAKARLKAATDAEAASQLALEQSAQRVQDSKLTGIRLTGQQASAANALAKELGGTLTDAQKRTDQAGRHMVEADKAYTDALRASKGDVTAAAVQQAIYNTKIAEGLDKVDNFAEGLVNTTAKQKGLGKGSQDVAVHIGKLFQDIGRLPTKTELEIISNAVAAGKDVEFVNGKLVAVGKQKPRPKVTLVDLATRNIDDIRSNLLGLRDRNLTITTTYRNIGNPANRDFAGGHAAGVRVGGPLSAGDSVPAILAPGEVVLNQRQQSMVGSDRIMGALAATGAPTIGGAWHGYAKGGKAKRKGPGGQRAPSPPGMSWDDRIQKSSESYDAATAALDRSLAAAEGTPSLADDKAVWSRMLSLAVKRKAQLLFERRQSPKRFHGSLDGDLASITRRSRELAELIRGRDETGETPGDPGGGGSTTPSGPDPDLAAQLAQLAKLGGYQTARSRLLADFRSVGSGAGDIGFFVAQRMDNNPQGQSMMASMATSGLGYQGGVASPRVGVA